METLDEPLAVVTPPAPGAAWPQQGGIFVGTLPPIGEQPAVYLVASKDQTDLAWGPYGKDVANANSRHDGPANTRALLELGPEAAPAAAWCAQLQVGDFKDWYLPSQAELFMALVYAPDAFDKDEWYWSSTQDSRTTAFAQYFAYGTSHWDVKYLKLRVRAFRRIPFAA